jgi:parallel beta-helix repeat protein
MRAGITFVVAASVTLLAMDAPASATHVACGQVLTTDTALDSDIVCSETETAGLIVGASGITVRFNGHKISSPTVDSRDTGVYAESTVNNVTIRGGGTIEGFLEATQLTGSDNSVMRMTVTNTDCSHGIILSGDRAYAYRNTVNLTTTAIGCPGTGVWLGFTGGGQYSDPYAWGNTVTGGAFGVQVGGANARAVLNSVSNCSQTGVFVHSYDGTHAVGSINTVTGCQTGIANGLNFVEQSGNGRFRRNVVTNSTNGHGILISDRSAIVARNTANQSYFDGIHILTAGTIVRNNTANSNNGFGINAVEGVNDGGGNTATGNLNPDGQCLNVACGP